MCGVIWSYRKLWPSWKKEGREEGREGKSLTDLEGKGKMKEKAQILPPRLQNFKPTLPSFSVCDVYYTHLFVQTFNKLSVIFGGFSFDTSLEASPMHGVLPTWVQKTEMISEPKILVFFPAAGFCVRPERFHIYSLHQVITKWRKTNVLAHANSHSGC